MNLDRLESLVGLNNIVKIRNLNILVVGLGGVGGYAFLSLVRSGVGKFSIVDGDVIDVTNLNRQIISNSHNIGNNKAIEASKMAKLINKNVDISAYTIFIKKDNFDMFDISSFDYVVDACDDTEVKVMLINECLKRNVKIVSCMGTAKKMDASKLIITTLNKTSYDPLAKKVRKLIDKSLQKNVVVISSTEEAKDCEGLGSNSFVPGVAGLYITNYIINDVCNKN